MTSYRDYPFGRWVGMMLVFVLVCALSAPTAALARVEFVNGSGAAEGDPIDGLGSVGGGSGSTDDLDDGDIVDSGTVEMLVNTYPIWIIGPFFTCSDLGSFAGVDWIELGKLHYRRVK